MEIFQMNSQGFYLSLFIMIFKKILSYLTFRKQEGSKSNLNLRMMHGMNRISILMFAVALCVILVRFVFK